MAPKFLNNFQTIYQLQGLNLHTLNSNNGDYQATNTALTNALAPSVVNLLSETFIGRTHFNTNSLLQNKLQFTKGIFKYLMVESTQTHYTKDYPLLAQKLGVEGDTFSLANLQNAYLIHVSEASDRKIGSYQPATIVEHEHNMEHNHDISHEHGVMQYQLYGQNISNNQNQSQKILSQNSKTTASPQYTGNSPEFTEVAGEEGEFSGKSIQGQLYIIAKIVYFNTTKVYVNKNGRPYKNKNGKIYLGKQYF